MVVLVSLLFSVAVGLYRAIGFYCRSSPLKSDKEKKKNTPGGQTKQNFRNLEIYRCYCPLGYDQRVEPYSTIFIHFNVARE